MTSERDLELYRACATDQPRDAALIRRLLEEGANPDREYGRQPYEVSPLIALIRHRNPGPEDAVIHLLLDHGAQVDYQTASKYSALLAVVEMNLVPAARILLARGADPNLAGRWHNSPGQPCIPSCLRGGTRRWRCVDC